MRSRCSHSYPTNLVLVWLFLDENQTQSQLPCKPGTCLAIPRRDPDAVTATLQTWYLFGYSLTRSRCSHSYPTNLVLVWLFLDEIQMQLQLPYKPNTCLAIPRREPDAVTATLQTWYLFGYS